MTGSSSCAARASWILGQESSCHASSETICLTLKKLLGRDTNDWINAINQKLVTHEGSKLRVLARQPIPTNAELNCEVFCSQRLYGEDRKSRFHTTYNNHPLLIYLSSYAHTYMYLLSKSRIYHPLITPNAGGIRNGQKSLNVRYQGYTRF